MWVALAFKTVLKERVFWRAIIPENRSFPFFIRERQPKKWPRRIKKIMKGGETGHKFCQGGGGGGGAEPFSQKVLSSCPNFYDPVERKRGSYDALTMDYI